MFVEVQSLLPVLYSQPTIPIADDSFAVSVTVEPFSPLPSVRPVVSNVSGTIVSVSVCLTAE